MDGGAWWATVHGVTKSQPRLGDGHCTVSGEAGWNCLRIWQKGKGRAQAGRVKRLVLRAQVESARSNVCSAAPVPTPV